MKNEENKYAIAFDANKDFREIRSLSPSETRDVRTLISILREIVGENDTMMLAALVNEEAELKMGETDLPTVKQLAHELIDIAQKALAALGEAEPPR